MWLLAAGFVPPSLLPSLPQSKILYVNVDWNRKMTKELSLVPDFETSSTVLSEVLTWIRLDAAAKKKKRNISQDN
jgi:hypothetical protein